MSAFRTTLLRNARTSVRSPIQASLKTRPSAFNKRSFATDPPVVPPPSPSGSKASTQPWFIGGVGVAALGAAYYFFLSGDGTVQDQGKKVDTAVKTAGAVVEAKTGLKRGIEDYQKVYNAIAESLDSEDYDDGSYGPVLVRLAWHSSGTYDKESNTGGSNYATMRFDPEAKHGANNGLNFARDHMEKIKKQFPWISYGDLWTLGGVASVQELGGPYVPWRPGRIDGFEINATPDGRLPDASQAQDHLRKIFHRMGFNDREIVALSGAHALGRCHDDRSGFSGPWQFSPTSFNNEYYKLLLNEKWGWKKWAGPKQYEDVKTKSLMMLPTDMAIIKDKTFLPVAKEYAENEELFFKEFAAVFHKLLELGVPPAQFASEPWKLKTTSDQEA